jgi:uncharacterized membrane protein YjgN (DUF898 family)
VIAGLWTALNHPIVFLVLLGLFILLMIWLLPKIFPAIRAVYRKVRSMFGGAPPEPAAATEAAASGTDVMADEGFSLSLKDDQAKD